MGLELPDSIQSHISGLQQKTGKSIDFWVDLVRSWNEPKHMVNVNKLKAQFGIGHGHANLVVHMAKENTALHMSDDQLETEIFKGKELWKPLHRNILKELQASGSAFEIVPKKKYYSVRTSKQVGCLVPATKGRYEVWINLPGQEPKGDLRAMRSGSMCSHSVQFIDAEANVSEAVGWLLLAMERSEQ